MYVVEVARFAECRKTTEELREEHVSGEAASRVCAPIRFFVA